VRVSCQRPASSLWRAVRRRWEGKGQPQAAVPGPASHGSAGPGQSQPALPCLGLLSTPLAVRPSTRVRQDAGVGGMRALPGHLPAKPVRRLTYPGSLGVGRTSGQVSGPLSRRATST